jgi:cyanophycinase-like exopeptidase
VRAIDKRRFSPKGTVILIGGAEDKGRGGAILREIARLAGKGPIIICTAGSLFPEETAECYRKSSVLRV